MLYSLIIPPVYGWYVVAVIYFTPGKVGIEVKNVHRNYHLLSDTILSSVPHMIIHLIKKILVT